MPNNKKKRSAKKRSTKADISTNNGASTTSSDKEIQSRVRSIFRRCPIKLAEDLEQRFKATWPPSRPLDALPRHKQHDAEYSKVSKTFNVGLALTHKSTGVTGLSRWHLVMEKMSDALEIITSNDSVQKVFLETTGSDHRSLLCSIVSTIAQMYQKMCLYEYVKAWSKVTIAADPTYFKGYSQIATAIIYVDDDWKGGIEACRKSLQLGSKLPDRKREMQLLKERIASIEIILHGSKQASAKEKKTYIADNAGVATRFWQDLNIPRPPKTCALCFCPGDSKCAKCKSVYYCSRRCQKLDYGTHKHVCVEPAKENLMEIIETPNFPTHELMNCQKTWDMMVQSAKAQKTSVLMASANNCCLPAVKRAMMEGADVNGKCPRLLEHPLHVAALRREPENAVAIVRTLIHHGACPNVVRGDGVHLLSICRERAKWIDDDEPSQLNSMFQMTHRMAGLLGDLSKKHGTTAGNDNDIDKDDLSMLSTEQMERRESAELVQLVTAAISQHKLCNHCKARKKMKGNDIHLRVGNLTDDYLTMRNLGFIDGDDDDEVQ